MTLEDWWRREGDWVEPPNLRRDGESGVKRVQDPALGLLYVKLQTNHLYRSLRYPFGRPTVLRERDALQQVAGFGITVPTPVFCDDSKAAGRWRAVLVTRDLAGYRDLARWGLRRSKGKISDERHQEMINALGKMLGTLHRHRWQHTNLYPNHIFTTHDDADGPVRVALIDLENSRRSISAKLAAHRDLQQLHKRADMFSAADWQLLLESHVAAQYCRRTPA